MTSKELTSFDEFRQARLDDAGFIVIMDTARASIVHKLNVPCVSPENFKVKVLLNEKRTGKYVWVDTVASGALEFGAALCKVCKPHRPDKTANKY